MVDLNTYEQKQVREIQSWKNKEPDVVSKAFGWVLTPLTWLVNAVVPKAAIRGALDFANMLGDWLADTSDIKRDGDVKTISDLKTKDITLSDKLANEVHNWAIL